ncbi:MAG TPA: response regulator transcription factor [Atopostipes sp.]|nr:response regulator transcription factor [Atopostipes sp.]
MSQLSRKVLLVDDEQLIRSGLAILLDSYSDIDIVGQVANGKEAAEFCESNEVDLVLMDIRMPEVNGIEGTKIIKSKQPEIKVLILTTFQDAEYIAQAMRLGASGYLLKDSSSEEIYESINIVMNDNIVLDGNIGMEIASLADAPNEMLFEAEKYQLSEKEVRIIQLVASGLSNQEIADQMFLSIGTIKNNISTILSKLELRDRTQLAIFAFEEGLMQ